MKKLMLLVPLCICVIAGMVMSGCGSSDIIDIPAAITSLTISDGGGDIPFSFTYIDNPDVTETFVVEYAEALTPTSFTDAIVVDSLGDPAVLTAQEPGSHTFYWDTDNSGIGAGVADGAYIFRVQVDSSLLPDSPANLQTVTVNNAP